jgi:type I restriction enzyme S subunit
MRSGWVETDFGTVASWSSGKNITADRRHETGSVPILGANGIIGRTNESLLDVDLITVGRVGACGETHRSMGPVWVSDNALIAIPNESIIYDYLYYQLSTFDYKKIISGTTQPLITQTKLKSQTLHLPPIDEQRRIVNVLLSVDNYINALEQQIVMVLRTKSSLLEDQLGQEFAGAKQVKLGDVLEISRGGSPRPIQSYLTDSDDGLNWIKIGDASNSTKYIYETKQKIKREGLSKTRQVFPGDFLLSNSMSFGRPYIMRTEGCIHDGWLLLGGVSKHFDEDFLYNLLRSSLIQAKFSSQAAGSGVKNLNIDIVSDVEITLPSIPDQRKIAELLNSFDAQELALEDLLSKALAMRNALLGDLLSGNHEIPESYDSFLEAV